MLIMTDILLENLILILMEILFRELDTFNTDNKMEIADSDDSVKF